MKKQNARMIGTVERERESYTLRNKAFLREPKKYRLKKDSSTIFVSEIDTR